MLCHILKTESIPQKHANKRLIKFTLANESQTPYEHNKRKFFIQTDLKTKISRQKVNQIKLHSKLEPYCAQTRYFYDLARRMCVFSYIPPLLLGRANKLFLILTAEWTTGILK